MIWSMGKREDDRNPMTLMGLYVMENTELHFCEWEWQLIGGLIGYKYVYCAIHVDHTCSTVRRGCAIDMAHHIYMTFATTNATHYIMVYENLHQVQFSYCKSTYLNLWYKPAVKMKWKVCVRTGIYLTSILPIEIKSGSIN